MPSKCSALLKRVDVIPTGVMVSTERVTELLLSLPSALLLPAESENVELATEMTPSVVLSAVGVNVAE